MEQQGVYSSNLLGHSMGGKTAMEFALEYPDQVDKLIIVDIAPKAYPPGHDQIFEALLAIDLNTLSSRQAAEEILRGFIQEDGVIQFLLKNLSRTKEGGFEWKMNLPVLYRCYPELLSAPKAQGYFSGETLFVRGGKSDYVLDSDLPAIRAHFPNYQLETIPQAGHWVHADAPAALLKLVLDFLRR
jgi:pimeloyl-ACP methyl ester carboxylesterase